MDETKLLDLLERYIENTLSDADRIRLEELITSSPANRRTFWEYMHSHALLFELAAEARGQQLATETTPRRGRFSGKWARVAAVVAAGWVVAIVALIVLHQPPAIRLVSVSPDVKVERRAESIAAETGMALHVGETVRVPAQGWAWIRYQDGTLLQMGSGSELAIEGSDFSADRKRVLLTRGAVTADVAPQPAGSPMILATPLAEATVLGTSLALAVSPDSTRLLVRHGRVAFSKAEDHASLDVTGGHAATAMLGKPLVAESMTGEVLKRLGKDHFMLGVMSGWAESWVTDTRAQGCRWDLRYQHLTSGWTQWNPNGSFVSMYAEESDRLGILPVFTYYGLVRPAKNEAPDPATEIARCCGDRSTMKKYFSDLALFMQKAGKHGKPVILHVEPTAWGRFLSAPEFRPNVPEKVRVEVQSTGLAELEGLDDSLASFGKAFGVLRDRYAPNVLLAWHASKAVPAAAAADAMGRCGAWDLVFTDVADRDAGFQEAHGIANAGWTEKDFTEFRDWGADLHARTGLPLVVWRIPLGNTHMATCNNTPWHYMDNRVEYWLEGYPSNARISEWAKAGFVGLLFGGGAIECTVHKDNAKDGVTNPPAIPGNRGERSAFPDDDGGYLRLRAGKYYEAGPLRLDRN